MGSVHPLQPRPVVVGRPCAGDAIGVALRDVYIRDCRVPDDMIVLLNQLNGKGAVQQSL